MFNAVPVCKLNSWVGNQGETKIAR